MKTEAAVQFWSKFCAQTGHTGHRYEVVAFGDSVAMKNDLAALIASGQKRASAGLLRSFTEEDLPREGDFVLVIDGQGAPVCIYLSREVRIGPLDSVDDQFARDEGEGDRSRAWWLKAHQEFFTREAEAEGFEMSDDIETVFERFTVIWPPELADPG